MFLTLYNPTGTMCSNLDPEALWETVPGGDYQVLEGMLVTKGH